MILLGSQEKTRPIPALIKRMGGFTVDFVFKLENNVTTRVILN